MHLNRALATRSVAGRVHTTSVTAGQREQVAPCMREAATAARKEIVGSQKNRHLEEDIRGIDCTQRNLNIVRLGQMIFCIKLGIALLNGDLCILVT